MACGSTLRMVSSKCGASRGQSKNRADPSLPRGDSSARRWRLASPVCLSMTLTAVYPLARHALIVWLFTLAQMQGGPGFAAPSFEPDTRTVFLLEADLAKGALVDRTGQVSPNVRGGEAVADE